MQTRDSDEQGLLPETEYVLSQQEWDKLQARIEKLEAGFSRKRYHLEELELIVRNIVDHADYGEGSSPYERVKTIVIPNRVFQPVFGALARLSEIDEGTDDHDG